MEFTQLLYAISFPVLLVLQLFYYCFMSNNHKIYRFFNVYVKYPLILTKFRCIGVLSRRRLLVTILYWIINLGCNFLRAHSITEASRRASTLALINLTCLCAGVCFSSLTSLTGFSLSTLTVIHSSLAFLASVQILFHSLTALREFSIHDGNHFYGLLVTYFWYYLP